MMDTLSPSGPLARAVPVHKRRHHTSGHAIRAPGLRSGRTALPQDRHPAPGHSSRFPVSRCSEEAEARPLMPVPSPGALSGGPRLHSPVALSDLGGHGTGGGSLGGVILPTTLPPGLSSSPSLKGKLSLGKGN